MSKWFKQYIAIAKNSYVVIMGDPLSLIIHLFIIVAILMIASLPGFTLGGQLKLVRDQVLALSFICGCLFASVSVTRVIGDELRKGMIPTIMSRPVSASALLFGKWSGLVFALFIVFLSATVASLWASRLIHHEHSLETLGLLVYLGIVLLTLLGTAIHHYKRGGNYLWQANIALVILFPITFALLNFWGYNGVPAGYGILVDWQTAFAFMYIFMALVIFSSIILFFSVIMDISLLMAFSVFIFFGGLFSEYIIGLIVSSSVIRACFSIIIPDWQMFWITEHLSSVATFYDTFFWGHLFHAVFQSILFVLLASILFERKEVSGTV